MIQHGIPHKEGKARKVSPTSLNELIWGRVLNDHLYEVEKGELEKATGKKEGSRFLSCWMCDVGPTLSDGEDPRQARLPYASSGLIPGGGFYPGALNEYFDEDADDLPPVIWLSISDGDRGIHFWKHQERITENIEKSGESMRSKTKKNERESQIGVVRRLFSRSRERSQSPFRGIRRALSKSRNLSRSRNLTRSKRTTKSRSSIPLYIETKATEYTDVQI
jgi:hypothetical protein